MLKTCVFFPFVKPTDEFIIPVLFLKKYFPLLQKLAIVFFIVPFNYRENGGKIYIFFPFFLQYLVSRASAAACLRE